MKVNQKLYDKFGNELVIKSVKNNTYSGILCYRKFFTDKSGLMRDAGTYVEIELTDEDLGVEYFFDLEDIGNRKKLFEKEGPYYFNRVNIEKRFEKYMSDLKSDLPYGTLMTGEEGRQEVINSFFEEKENAKEKEFVTKHSLCFGRIDLDTKYSIGHEVKYFDEHFHDIIYISKSPYHRYGNIQVVNWRSNIASLYYEKSMLHKHSLHYIDVFSEDRGVGIPGSEYDYTVMLRRDLSSTPFVSRTTYVCGSPKIADKKENEQVVQMQQVYTEGGIDPFLLKVIEEKRLESKLTDIITTIQANQNAMIRHTAKKNMIIQGCAGSGKTMILLHRISYLKYNNLLRNFKRAVIIVPNVGFNVFIDELTSNLEIEQIPRYTMAQYYLKLIGLFQKRIYTDSLNQENKVLQIIEKLETLEFTKGNITNSNELFNEELEYDICDFYEQNMTQLITDVQVEKIQDLATRFHVAYENGSTGASSLNNLFNCVSKIKESFDKKTQTAKSALDEVKRRYNNAKTSEKHIRNLMKLLKALFEEKDYSLTESFCQLVESFSPKKGLEEKHSRLIREANELERQVKSESRGFLRFVAVKSEAKQKLEQIKEQIKKIEKQLSKEETTDSEPKKYTEIKKVFSDFQRWRSENLSITKRMSSIMDEYDNLVQILLNENIPLENLLEKFKNLVKDINECEYVQVLKLAIESEEKEYEEVCNSYMSLDERRIIRDAIQRLENREEIVKDIFEKFTNIEFKKIHSIRHLFILLALYFLHVGKITIGCDFIFIDEAQDYSDIEYRLLRAILDEKTIVEAYGDYMQQITPNRGITDWSQLKMLLGDDYFELKENYRNTVEISDFINSRIRNVFTSIGMRGEKVKILMSEWQEQALREIQSDSAKRVAIICKDRQSFLFNYNVCKIPASNIFTVLEAKGLEFETVYVIDKNMTDNEKYIAYSRALKSLYVVEY